MDKLQPKVYLAMTSKGFGTSRLSDLGKRKIIVDRQVWVGWSRWTYFYIADFERQLSGIISGTK